LVTTLFCVQVELDTAALEEAVLDVSVLPCVAGIVYLGRGGREKKKLSQAVNTTSHIN